MATYARKLKDGDGSYICPATRSDLVYFPDNSVLSKLTYYPVGCIYQSTDSASPASLFGGEWEQIQGRFLLGTSNSHTVESTGGEENHVLTLNELASHAHNPTGVTDGRYIITDNYGSGGILALAEAPGRIVTVSWDQWSTSYVGGNQPHNNMPPYFSVNIWRRTA